MLLTMALTALFSFQAVACDGCGCKKGEDDDGDEEVRMGLVETSADIGYCGKDKNDGDGDG